MTFLPAAESCDVELDFFPIPPGPPPEPGAPGGPPRPPAPGPPPSPPGCWSMERRPALPADVIPNPPAPAPREPEADIPPAVIPCPSLPASLAAPIIPVMPPVFFIIPFLASPAPAAAVSLKLPSAD